jgi:hypothetical protein
MAALSLATLPRWAARLVLALALALSAYGLVSILNAPPASPAAATTPMARDAELYRAIAARVATGEDYYTAAATEQRARNYPLKPFVTVRPPLLATVTAWAGGPTVMGVALQLLVLATVLALIVRLRGVIDGPTARIPAIGLAGLSLLVIAQPDLALWHEAWAAVLVTLALALHSANRWWPSLLIALLAACLRELAVPFLLVMGFCALTGKRRAEALAWGVALAIAAAALARHAVQVAAVVTSADPVSPGWGGAGGWPFVVSMLGKTSAFALVPPPVVALLLPLALLGWMGCTDPFGRRVALWLLGMVAAFMVFGRPDNFYWGMMLAPLLPIGLAFAPSAIRSLARQSR